MNRQNPMPCNACFRLAGILINLYMAETGGQFLLTIQFCRYYTHLMVVLSFKWAVIVLYDAHVQFLDFASTTLIGMWAVGMGLQYIVSYSFCVLLALVLYQVGAITLNVSDCAWLVWSHGCRMETMSIIIWTCVTTISTLRLLLKGHEYYLRMGLWQNSKGQQSCVISYMFINSVSIHV